jgi:hypothetical protein
MSSVLAACIAWIGNAGDVTLTWAGCDSAAVVNFQAAAVTDFHSAIALRR